MEKQLKKIKSLLIILAILVCFSQALHGMEEPQKLLGDFKQLSKYELEMIISNLSDRDLANLAQTSKQASKVIKDELAQRHLQAITESVLWITRIKIIFSDRVTTYPRFNEFKQAVLDKLRKTKEQNPDKWISLDLGANNLGSIPSEDLKVFIQSIAKFPIVELHLLFNHLSSLPEDIFEGFHILRELNLFNNNLDKVPKNLFKGLDKLQKLHLSWNPITSSTSAESTRQLLNLALPKAKIYWSDWQL